MKAKDRLKTIIDRPWARQHANKIMNKMITELSPYMISIELDQCMDFM